MIDQYTVIQYPLPDPPYWSEPYATYQAVAMITRTIDDLVLVWTNTWDTLYWFNAQPGDRWHYDPTNEHTCEPFVVADIGTETMNGLPIRWLDLEHGVRVYERLGALRPLFCPNWIVDGPIGLRCYSDHTISVNFSDHGCETLANVDELSTLYQPPPYPNPGIAHFTLELPPGTHTIRLYEASGRQVAEQQASVSPAVIDTRPLTPGLYHVRVQNDQGSGTRHRWVKE